MVVDNDIKSAYKVIDNDLSVQNCYKKVKIFPRFTLKYFKRLELDNKKVLSKVNSIEEILDLLRYNADVTCFSKNRLDEYFINLFIKVHNLDKKTYAKFIFNDLMNKNIYDIVKNDLDDKTRYFFDELYKLCEKRYKNISNIISDYPYLKEIFVMYIRNYFYNRYSKIDTSIEYWPLNESQILETFKNNSFDIINFSNEIDKNLNNKEIDKYTSLLKPDGQVLSYVSRDKLDIDNHYRLESRSILDPFIQEKHNIECKKDYLYVYKK